MTVSKAFWKIILKNIGIIVVYSIILILFGSMNLNSNSTNLGYEAKKPSIVIFNHDEETGITKNLISYLDRNTTIEKDYQDNDKLKDALFFESVILVIDIPENYHEDFLQGKNPEIKLRSSSGYSAELAKIIVERYFTTASVYQTLNLPEDEIIAKIDDTLSSTVQTEVKTRVANSADLSRANQYFSFASYSILACVLTVICLVMSSFNRLEIRKRNLIGTIDYKKINRVLLINSIFYTLGVWLLYIIVGFIIVGFSTMWSFQGLLYVVNSLVFSIVATTIALLISKLVHKKGAISGVVNVVALGSSFLCGAFVPIDYLPDGVTSFAHILPAYYYIDTNSRITTLDSSDFATIWPILLNMLIMLGFCVLFIIITNLVSRAQRKVA